MIQFIKYVVVGVINTFIGYGIIFACMFWLGIGPVVSNMIGYAIGLVISYVLHRNVTFQSTQGRRSEALRFVAVFGVAYSLNLLMLMLLIDRLHWHKGWAQVVAGVVYVGVSFLMQKLYVFRTARVN